MQLTRGRGTGGWTQVNRDQHGIDQHIDREMDIEEKLLFDSLLGPFVTLRLVAHIRRLLVTRALPPIFSLAG